MEKKNRRAEEKDLSKYGDFLSSFDRWISPSIDCRENEDTNDKDV